MPRDFTDDNRQRESRPSTPSIGQIVRQHRFSGKQENEKEVSSELPLQDESESQQVEAGIERRAVKQRWNIPDDKRQAIIDRQCKIATESESDIDATRAANCLVKIDQLNFAAEKEESFDFDTPIRIDGGEKNSGSVITVKFVNDFFKRSNLNGSDQMDLDEES